MTLLEYMVLSQGELPKTIRIRNGELYNIDECSIGTKQTSQGRLLIVDYGILGEQWEPANNVEVVIGRYLYKQQRAMIQWIKKLLKKSNEKRDAEIQRIKEEKEEFSKKMRRDCQADMDREMLIKINSVVYDMVAEYKHHMKLAELQGILEKMPQWEPLILIPVNKLGKYYNVYPPIARFKDDEDVIKEVMRLYFKKLEEIKQQYGEDSRTDN